MVQTIEEAKPAENQLGETVYCDVIVSDAKGVLAGVKTADCVPILIGDPVTGAFAAVHAGWRGTFATAVMAGVETFGGGIRRAAGRLARGDRRVGWAMLL